MTLKHKILVSPIKTKTGQWSKRRMVYAAFRIKTDCDAMLDSMHIEQQKWPENQRWIIEYKKA